MQQTETRQPRRISNTMGAKGATRQKSQIIAPYRVDLPRQDVQPIAVPCDINGRSLATKRL